MFRKEHKVYILITFSNQTQYIPHIPSPLSPYSFRNTNF